MSVSFCRHERVRLWPNGKKLGEHPTGCPWVVLKGGHKFGGPQSSSLFFQGEISWESPRKIKVRSGSPSCFLTREKCLRFLSPKNADCVCKLPREKPPVAAVGCPTESSLLICGHGGFLQAPQKFDGGAS